jgi:myo-inositol-1(or 4)-monophosphatase
MTAPEATELAELADLAAGAARAVGAMLLDGLHEARTEVSTKSTGTDMVTEMDRAAERMIVEHLLGARPDDGLLGEEGSNTAGSSGIRWVIDPLDGTTNYLYGLPGWGVSIAAELDGVAVAGVVLDPGHDQLFRATLAGGATCNGATIAATDEHDVATALIGTGFAYAPERRRRQAEVLATVLPRIRDIRRWGAAAVDLCSVACGRLDGYFEAGLAPWDLAAGALIAAEAGALVGDLGGGPPSGAFCLAAPPGLFAPLRDLLAAAGADQP